MLTNTAVRTVVIALVIVVVLIVLVRGCGGSDEAGDAQSPPADEPQSEEALQEEPEEDPQPEPEPVAAIGDTVEAGDVTWQITSATQVTELTSEFMDPRQGNFIIVDFLFTNNANEFTTLSSNSLTLFDGEGREFEPDTDTFGYIDPDLNVFLNQVNPGVTDEGQVIFTVAPGAAGFTLEVGDGAIFSDESATVDLSF